MTDRWIILAGEEAGPKTNKMGGIWEVIDAEATALASMKAATEIKEDVGILIAGPYYPAHGTDWNTGQDRVTSLDGLNPLEPGEDLERILRGMDAFKIVTASRDVDGFPVGYVLFDLCDCAHRYGESGTKSISDEIKEEAYRLVKLDSMKYENTGYGQEYTHYLELSHAVSHLARGLQDGARVSLHCHEYGVFYAAARLKVLRDHVTTMATFHATKPGRAWGAETLNLITKGDGRWHPHTPEGLAVLEALAKYADHATAVGDTTRREARLFYGIDALVVRNGIRVSKGGIDWDKRAASLSILQNVLSEKIYEHYDGERLDPEHILPVFTISRIELENKGYPDLLDSLVVYDRIMRNHIHNGMIDPDTKTVCIMITAIGPKDPARLPEGFPVYVPDELLEGEELRLRKMVKDHGLHLRDFFDKRRTTAALLYPTWARPGDGGFNMDVSDIAAGCVAAIFPSRYDPFLLTGLEAGAEGTPVVVSRICGFSDAVMEYEKKEGAVGGVVVGDNVKLPYLETITDYATGLESITKAYLRDKGKYKMMCREAHHLAEDMTWEEPVRKYYEIMSH